MSTSPTSSSRGDARATIAVAALATAMLMLDISVVNAALSDIAASLRTDLAGLQWIVDAYTLPLAATVLTAGAIADRLGRRRVFAGGLILFTVASAAAGLSPGVAGLVTARAVTTPATPVERPAAAEASVTGRRRTRTRVAVRADRRSRRR